jgi:hypothetical protein
MKNNCYYSLITAVESTIMSDLISELWKRIIQIAQIENRPSFCSEFVPCFELDGGTYSIAYGTIAAVKAHRLEMMSDNE